MSPVTGVSLFGYSTVPELVDVHVIAHGARGTNTPARKQEPEQDQQEQERE